MDWWTLGYIIILAIVINFTYRKGVRAGIKHSILVLDLEQDQIQVLDNELKYGKLSQELMSKEIYPKDRSDIRYN
tara:strand:+ start:303 stop:527 length:225 start_codon:yes stop_codon:yes gene_type:complete